MPFSTGGHVPAIEPGRSLGSRSHLRNSAIVHTQLPENRKLMPGELLRSNRDIGYNIDGLFTEAHYAGPRRKFDPGHQCCILVHDVVERW